MPKEITHFALADILGRSLSGNPLFYGPVKKFPNLFRLGAIAPDIPFFYLAGPSRTKGQALGSPFHQSHEGALSPVLAFLVKDQSPPALALAAGVICHILSDTHFHPLVYYYAGMDGEHKGATGRHRSFETAMDIHFWFRFKGETRLNRVIRHLEVPRGELSRLLAGLFCPCPPLPTAAPLAALNQFRGIQFLFRASAVRNGLAWLNRKGRPVPEKISGLVYPFDHPVFLPFFAGELFYQDPSTREVIYTDLSTMIAQTIESGQRVLGMVARALAAGGEKTVLTGLPRIRPDLPAVKVWHRKHDIRPLIYQGLDSPF